MYRIYINEIRLTIAESMPNASGSYQLLEEKDFSLSAFYQQFALSKASANYLLLHASPAECFRALTRDFCLIEAAGGLVKNAHGEYLFIFRRGKWDLPKGKIDAGEMPDTAALREVEEECGLRPDELGPLLAETYHIYPMDNQLVLKRTYWYEMGVNGVPRLIPQLEEDITQAGWLKPAELDQVKANTFPLILDIIADCGL
ncbi:MAG: NUDIX hydrolase [Sphingobacteriaceae bacterium]